MKAQLLSIALFCFATVLFTSCDPNELDDASVYWNSNTLTRMGLNGQVKTLTTTEGKQVYEFNQDGYITKSVYTDTEFTSTSIYNYDSNNKLSSIDFTSTGGKGVAYTTTFEYENVGKYIVQNQYHLLMDGLVPNLRSISNEFSRTDYVFNGNVMWIINTYTGEANYMDTVVVNYDGKYPVSLTYDNGFVNNITYTSNGMFKTYVSGNQGEGYSNISEYYFRPDDQFLLIDSVVHTSTYQSVSSVTVDKYSYNSNKNIIYEESFNSNYDYSYTYDSHNNWITKATRYKPKETTVWGSPTTETRTITYW